MTFFIITGGMALMISCLLAYILLFRFESITDANNDKRIKRNVRLFNNRSVELEKDLSFGFINQETFNKLSLESSRVLIRTVTSIQKSEKNKVVGKKWLFGFIFAPLFAILIYQSLGAYPDWRISSKLEQLKFAQTPVEYQAYVIEIQKLVVARLANRPNNLDYRFLAARFAMNAGDFDTAVAHFSVISELLPNDPDALAYLAQAQYLKDNRYISEETKKYLDRALELNPHQSTALSLAGMSAFERGQYRQAIYRWNTLLDKLPEGSDQRTIILAGIKKAKENLLDGSMEKNNGQAISDSGVSILVTLDPKLMTIEKHTTVYVYIKAANGPPMPLAVKKITVEDLPAKIFLDDSSAMMPKMKLSNFEEVIAGVRISLSGHPTPQAGDWEVESSVFEWRSQPELSLYVKDRI